VGADAVWFPGRDQHQFRGHFQGKLTEVFALAEDAVVKVDLARECIILPDGEEVHFPVPAFSKSCLLQGVDELGWILDKEGAIAAYEGSHTALINTLE
jgi:3-isopropylmalate/(R)-2-methylmalate dehydratase small subunit